MGEERCLDVTLLSGQGLKDVYTFGKMSPFAKVWIDPMTTRCTPPAINAGCTPVWDHKLSLPLPCHALKDERISLSIEIWSQGSNGDTIVGRANVPLKDIVSNASPNKSQFMACQLLRPSGRIQGLVNFSLEIADVKPSLDPNLKISPSDCKSKKQDSPSSSSTSNTLSNSSGPSCPRSLVKAKGLQSLYSGGVEGGHKISSFKLPKTFEASARMRYHSPRNLSDPRQQAGPSDDSLNNLAGSTNDTPVPASQGSVPQTVQNSLPGIGEKMFGGVAGALLLGESMNMKVGNSQNQGQVHHGSNVGDWYVSEPESGGNSTGGVPGL